MLTVAADKEATAGQIVKAGRAVDAAHAGETVLVTYTVHNDDDEGRSAGAWRLRTTGGQTLAEGLAGVTDEGHAHPDVRAVPDGYLLHDEGGLLWHVDTSGTRDRVRLTREPQAPRPGDVALDWAPTWMYRPSTRTRFRAAPVPRGNWQGWTVGVGGTVWAQAEPGPGQDTVPFARSATGAPWEQVAGYRPARGQWVSGGGFTAVGTQVAAPLITAGDQPDKATLAGVIVRASGRQADQRWRLLKAPEVSGKAWWDAHLTPVDDDTLAVGTSGSAPYLLSLRDGTWTRLEFPTSQDGWSYDAEAGDLYATHQDHADAWYTEDLGATWERLPH